MNALVHQIFDGKTSRELNRIANNANVPRATIDSWLRQDRTPRIDLVSRVATAAGFELILQPCQKPKATTMPATATADPTKYQLVNKDGRIDVMVNRSRLVGYVEDDTLTALDKAGYAVQVGPINHRTEIIGKLDAWRQQNM